MNELTEMVLLSLSLKIFYFIVLDMQNYDLSKMF